MSLLTEPLALVERGRRIDRVALVFVASVGLLALLAPDQVLSSLAFTAKSMGGILVFLVISVIVAAYAKATGLDRQIAIAFTGHPRRAIVLAAAFGALSPFCSCGVVPIIAGLLGAGVPLAPVMAFWLASPLMDPQMFVLLVPVFGLPFAIAKLLAAFVIGAVAGGATHMMMRGNRFADPLRPGVGGGCGCAATGAMIRAPVDLKFWAIAERRRVFAVESGAAGWFLAKWLTLAFFVESLMMTYIPAAMIGQWLGGDGWWSIPAAVILGVPAYLNGFAAIPTVSALIEMGMAPGAGLGFMLAGGVTSIPAAMAVFALVKRPVFFWYLAWGFGGSLVFAYAWQAWATILG